MAPACLPKWTLSLKIVVACGPLTHNTSIYCSCFRQEVRALQLLHKSNSFANWCTKSTNRILYHNDKVSIHQWEKNPDLVSFIAEAGGHWPPQHANNEVGRANYLVV